jgi:hypothetical protein
LGIVVGSICPVSSFGFVGYPVMCVANLLMEVVPWLRGNPAVVGSVVYLAFAAAGGAALVGILLLLPGTHREDAPPPQR